MYQNLDFTKNPTANNKTEVQEENSVETVLQNYLLETVSEAQSIDEAGSQLTLQRFDSITEFSFVNKVTGKKEPTFKFSLPSSLA